MFWVKDFSVFVDGTVGLCTAVNGYRGAVCWPAGTSLTLLSFLLLFLPFDRKRGGRGWGVVD